MRITIDGIEYDINDITLTIAREYIQYIKDYVVEGSKIDKVPNAEGCIPIFTADGNLEASNYLFEDKVDKGWTSTPATNTVAIFGGGGALKSSGTTIDSICRIWTGANTPSTAAQVYTGIKEGDLYVGTSTNRLFIVEDITSSTITWYELTGRSLVRTGTTPPTTNTSGSIGDFYFDTVALKLYQLVSIASNEYTWVPILSSNNIDALDNGGGSSNLYSTDDSHVPSSRLFKRMKEQRLFNMFLYGTSSFPPTSVTGAPPSVLPLNLISAQYLLGQGVISDIYHIDGANPYMLIACNANSSYQGYYYYPISYTYHYVGSNRAWYDNVTWARFTSKEEVDTKLSARPDNANDFLYTTFKIHNIYLPEGLIYGGELTAFTALPATFTATLSSYAQTVLGTTSTYFLTASSYTDVDGLYFRVNISSLTTNERNVLTFDGLQFQNGDILYADSTGWHRIQGHYVEMRNRPQVYSGSGHPATAPSDWTGTGIQIDDMYLDTNSLTIYRLSSIDESAFVWNKIVRGVVAFSNTTTPPSTGSIQYDLGQLAVTIQSDEEQSGSTDTSLWILQSYTSPTTNVYNYNWQRVGKPEPIKVVVTLVAANWHPLSKSQAITISGVTADSVVFSSPAWGYVEDVANSKIYCSGQSSDTLVFTCLASAPTSDVDMNVVIMN